MSIFIPSSNVKEGVFCILQMLKIHTGLRKFTKEDQFHILLKKINPQGINQPCQKIEKDEMLSEKYRIALNRDKYAIDIDGNDVFDSYRFFFQIQALHP